jgi:hypothetical protein
MSKPENVTVEFDIDDDEVASLVQDLANVLCPPDQKELSMQRLGRILYTLALLTGRLIGAEAYGRLPVTDDDTGTSGHLVPTDETAAKLMALTMNTINAQIDEARDSMREGLH